MKQRTLDMTSGPMFGNILRFSLPLAAGNLLQLTFNACDTMVVGRFAGDSCLAAVGSTGSLTSLLTMLFIGLSVGSNVIVGQRLGANDREGAANAVHTSLMVALLSGLFLAVFGVLISKPALRLMKSPDDIIDLAALYMRIIFLGMPANLVYNFGAAILRAKGDTRRPLYCLIVTGAANVALNVLFVAGFHWDVAGVALATILSQYASASFVWLLLLREEGAIRLIPAALSIDSSTLWAIARVGLPSGLQSIMMSISNVFIQTRLNELGSVVLAGSAASSGVENYVAAISYGIGQADVAFVSQNYGAGKYDRVRKVFWMTFALSLVITALCGAGAWVLAPYVFRLFSRDPAVIAAAAERFFWIGVLHAVGCIYDFPTHTLRGMGSSSGPMVCSVIGICGLRVFWMTVIFPLRPLASTIYMSYPLSWLLTGGIVSCMLFYRLRRLRCPAPADH